jgi:hypothetical protein
VSLPPSFSTAISGKEEVAVSSLSAKKIKKKMNYDVKKI